MNDAEIEANVIQEIQTARGPVFEVAFDRYGDAAAIDRLVKRRCIERYYEGGAGFMELAKLRIA